MKEMDKAAGIFDEATKKKTELREKLLDEMNGFKYCSWNVPTPVHSLPFSLPYPPSLPPLPSPFHTPALYFLIVAKGQIRYWCVKPMGLSDPNSHPGYPRQRPKTRQCAYAHCDTSFLSDVFLRCIPKERMADFAWIKPYFGCGPEETTCTVQM